MAVPASGELEMGSLALEKLYDDYNSGSPISGQVSMYDLVYGGNTNGSGNSYDTTNLNSPSFPDDVAPHSFSEWYSYDHDASGTGWNEAGFANNFGTGGCPSGDYDCDNGSTCITFPSKAAACAGQTFSSCSCTSIIWNGTLANNTVLYYVYNSCSNKTYPKLNGGGDWIRIVDGGGQGCGTGTNDGPNNAAWQGTTLAGKVMQVSSTGVVSNYGGCLTAYTSSDMGVFNETCPIGGGVHTLNQTYYHDGSGTYPTAGDTCYSDSAGSNPLAAGYYVLGNSTSGTFNRNYIFIDQNDGVVESGYPQSC